MNQWQSFSKYLREPTSFPLGATYLKHVTEARRWHPPLHHENRQEKKISKYQDMHIDINHLIMPAIYRWPLSYVENYFYRMAQPNNTISGHLISQYIIQYTMFK